MDSPYTPNMASSPFFFYTPEAQQEQQQHGQFSPQDHYYHGHFSPLSQYPAGVPFYPQLVKNPGVNYVQHYPVPDASMVFQNAIFPQQNILTPLASPQPIYHRPVTLVERRSPYLPQLATDFGPSTPPLSVSGSAGSSPPTAYPLLATPSNQSFALPEPMYGAKFEGDAFGEMLPQPEWMSPSPPHTPVFFYPSAEPIPTPATDVVTKHPISPSPSPLHSVKSASETAVSFCDPRELTVHSPVFHGLPTPTSHVVVKEETLYLPFADSTTPFEPLPPLPSDFLGTTGLYGLDFDNEFNHFSKSGFAENGYFVSHKRQRTELVPFTSEEDSFITEDAFSETEDDQITSAWLSTPSDLDSSFRSDMLTNPPSSSSSHESPEVESDVEYAADDTTENDGANRANSSEQNSSTLEDNISGSDGAMASGNQQSESGTPQSNARRGRKQSLTDDPSKTFICHLCNRRFRRQEHLKRHYRSLHTHDKPFKCTDCGKTFSRSDNLAQHQRTHGMGIALEMNDMGNGEGNGHHQAGSPESDSDRMAQILYQAAQRLATSTTPESSTSGSDESEISVSAAAAEKRARKRKRED